MNWIKRSISDEFRKTGKDKINDYLNYSSNPFSTLEEMKEINEFLIFFDQSGLDKINSDSFELNIVIKKLFKLELTNPNPFIYYDLLSNQLPAHLKKFFINVIFKYDFYM